MGSFEREVNKREEPYSRERTGLQIPALEELQKDIAAHQVVCVCVRARVLACVRECTPALRYVHIAAKEQQV